MKIFSKTQTPIHSHVTISLQNLAIQALHSVAIHIILPFIFATPTPIPGIIVWIIRRTKIEDEAFVQVNFVCYLMHMYIKRV